jgi:hypothetical protein
MSQDRTGADRVILLSLRQSIRRIPYLLRVCIWWLTFSLLIVTIPPALTALFYAVREGLKDPFELTVKPRDAFLRGVGLYAKKSYLLFFLNLFFFAAILLGIYFWFLQADPARYVTIVALAALFLWWLCQPFLLPVLIDQPELNVRQVYRRTFQVVTRSPLYALAITLMNTLLAIAGILLFGPSLFYIPSLMALISIQALWGMTGTEIPDLMDPVEYADKQDRKKLEQARNMEKNPESNSHL